MAKYIVKRVLLLIPTVLIIVSIVFLLMRVVPGSPVYALLEQEGAEITPETVEAKEEEMGFNDPLIVQYGRFLKGIVTGDWGESYFDERDVFQNILAVWEPSILMTLVSVAVTVVVGIPVGILSATRRNSLLDYCVTSSSMVAMCIPGFCLGLLLIYFCGFKWGWFPVVGYTSIKQGGIWQALYYVALPGISLGLHHVATLARYTRTTMLDVLGQDYIRTARAKGLSRNKVYYKHALKNTLSVTGTVIVNAIGGGLGGSAVMESVFNIKGLGYLAVKSLGRRDYSQEQAIVLFIAIIFLGVDLLNDIFYKLLDPRIEYE